MLFNTFVQRGVGIVILALLVYILLRLLVFRPKNVKKDESISSHEFEKEIYRLNEHCTEMSLKLFIAFLGKYKERNQYAFTEIEKGELKSLFFDVIVPEPDVAIATKEQFRSYLRGIGVSEMNIRPRYHDCTFKVTGSKRPKDDFFANYGDIKVGECLKKGLDSKEFYVIDGAVLTDAGKSKAFSHIIVGNSGAFVVSTKDLGSDIHESGIDPTEVFVTQSDKWNIRKKNNELDIDNPTEDILDSKKFVEDAMGDMLLDVHSLLVFPDEQLKVYQHGELPYKVLGTRNLCSYIMDYPSKMSLGEKTELISRLNSLISE